MPRGCLAQSPQSWGGRGGLLGSLMVGKFVPLAGLGLPREEPPLSCGFPFCAESSWLCHAVDSLLAQRYKEVWLVLVNSKIGESLVSLLERQYIHQRYLPFQQSQHSLKSRSALDPALGLVDTSTSHRGSYSENKSMSPSFWSL